MLVVRGLVTAAPPIALVRRVGVGSSASGALYTRRARAVAGLVCSFTYSLVAPRRLECRQRA